MLCALWLVLASTQTQVLCTFERPGKAGKFLYVFVQPNGKTVTVGKKSWPGYSHSWVLWTNTDAGFQVGTKYVLENLAPLGPKQVM